jgi:hypothetical protein
MSGEQITELIESALVKLHEGDELGHEASEAVTPMISDGLGRLS